MSQTRVAAVTGANKGLGFAIVRNLALQYPTSPFNNPPLPLLIYLTARDTSRGQSALSDINNDPQLKEAKALHSDGGPTTIKLAPLDISNGQSIKEFESFIKKEHPEGIDILVNNAGAAFDGFNASVVKDTLATNYYGTLALSQSLLPHLRPSGRLVNISSMAGKLNKYSPALTERFKSVRIIPDVTALMEEFQSAVEAGTQTEDGWPSAGYAVSKAGTTALTKVLGTQVKEGKFQGVKEGVLVNCCCPGYVSTDMTKLRGRKTPDQGAATPVKLAVGDLGGVNGEFWENEEVSVW